MSSNLLSKTFLKTRQGQIIFCVAGLAASLLFLASQFGGELGTVMPGNKGKDALQRELKKLQQDQEELQVKLNEIEAVRNIAAGKLEGAWKVSQNGVPEIELRGMIENAAKTLELRLNNISTVRRTGFNSELSLLELDVSVTTDIETLSKFLLAVDKLRPQLYWRRFECRSSNMFGVSAVQFNGTLRCGNDERSAAADDKKSAGRDLKKDGAK